MSKRIPKQIYGKDGPLPAEVWGGFRRKEVLWKKKREVHSEDR